MDFERAERWVAQLRNASFPNVFNPYAERCDRYDAPDACLIRSQALACVLAAAASRQVHALWVGRDLGYRGGRRTGLAFTDDAHLDHHGAAWRVQLRRATVGAPVTERSAGVIWNAIDTIAESVFLWNVFPLHSHQPGNSLSNRAHSRIERHWGLDILRQLIEWLEPMIVVAIGKDADTAIDRLQLPVVKVAVRHPSYGGQSQFNAQIGANFHANL